MYGLLTLIMLTSLSAQQHAATGIWKAVFVGPMGDRPRTVTEIVLDIHAVGTQLTGHVHMHNWPGDGSIEDGKINGNQISFTVNGTSPWKSGTGGTFSIIGYPKLRFVGTVKGDTMTLSVNWGSVVTGTLD